VEEGWIANMLEVGWTIMRGAVPTHTQSYILTRCDSKFDSEAYVQVFDER
jgi:hypothetical protein